MAGLSFAHLAQLHGIELLGHGALLVRGVVLVDESLGRSAVHGLDSNFIGAGSCHLVALGDCRVELLHDGLERSLLRAVAGVLHLALGVTQNRNRSSGRGKGSAEGSGHDGCYRSCDEQLRTEF